MSRSYEKVQMSSLGIEEDNHSSTINSVFNRLIY